MSNVANDKINTCLIPTPVEDVDGDHRWMSLHNRFLMESKNKEADVVFIGDTVVEALQLTAIWHELFVPLHCLNFGIRRDKVQNVLWRIKNGELDDVRPKAVVLHVGTNNHENTAEEIVDGILELIETIREKQTEAYIVLPTLLPRGQHPNPLRLRNDEVNRLLASRLARKRSCKGDGDAKLELIAIHEGFVQPPNGTISHHDMYDYLCLTDAGARKAFEPVYELLLQLVNENMSELHDDEEEEEEPVSSAQ